ncbi:CocE/NonD family hydrolase C-terminal non-catalytic domain-containing protein [Nonomuraea rubra]|uniref:CocE/NonD family hydrolase C-terminal non-catalytic domain-containing protein n=1 Tax=Nonomuraea rubra TaxID=46180 RepID=UPI00361B5C79
MDTLHRWFDHWLHGVRNGIMNEPRADVEIGPVQWVKQRDWPAPFAIKASLRPSADGSLGLRPAARNSTASFTDLAMSETDMVADVGTAHPGRVAFTTGALRLDLRLSGTPTADLRVKLDKPTSNLTALLVDFGDTTRVDWRRGQGITTLTEEDCHGESTAADDACYRKVVTNLANRPLEIVARGWIDVQNRQSLSQATPLPVGTYGTVRWLTLPQDYTFKKGHRIGLVIAGTDSTYTDEAGTGANVTVDLARSSVSVPFVLGTPLADVPQDTAKFRGPERVELPQPEPEFQFF